MKKFNKEIQSLIKKEGLDKPNIFFDNYGTFEEIPLFSRWAHVDFLKKYDIEQRNKILIQLANDVASKAISDAKTISNLKFDEYFICISVTDWDDIDELGCISPNIFISRRKTWLLSLLELREIESPEVNMLKTYLHDLNINEKIVCVSKSYEDEKDRVYIVDDSFLTKY